MGSTHLLALTEIAIPAEKLAKSLTEIAIPAEKLGKEVATWVSRSSQLAAETSSPFSSKWFLSDACKTFSRAC